RADLPVHRARLAQLAVTGAVQPQLSHHQRTLARQVLEPVQVRGQTVRLLEEDVEADEVQEVEPEVLGGRIVHVRGERRRVLRLHGPDQTVQEPLDRGRAVPAYDGGRDLVADRVAEDCGVPCARTNA